MWACAAQSRAARGAAAWWESFTGPPGDSILSVGGKAVQLLGTEAEIGFTGYTESELRGGSAGTTRAVRREDVVQGWKSPKSARLDLVFVSCPVGDVRHRVRWTKERTTSSPFQVAREGIKKTSRGEVKTQGPVTTREESQGK